MPTSFWNTLATRDLDAARKFYGALGFEVADTPVPGGITVRPSEDSLLCLFESAAFRAMIPGDLCEPRRAQEVIQSISVDAREDVDRLLATAQSAGGRAIGEATEQPYGYACGFTDPDGHVWAVLWFSTPGEA